MGKCLNSCQTLKVLSQFSELDRILESPLYLGVLDDLRRIKTQLLGNCFRYISILILGSLDQADK